MHKGHFKPKGCSSSCALSLCLTQVRQIHIRKREKKKGCAHHQGRDCRRIFFFQGFLHCIFCVLMIHFFFYMWQRFHLNFFFFFYSNTLSSTLTLRLWSLSCASIAALLSRCHVLCVHIRFTEKQERSFSFFFLFQERQNKK